MELNNFNQANPNLTPGPRFNNYRTMKSLDAVKALGALAQESRLALFRLLVKRGAIEVSYTDGAFLLKSSVSRRPLCPFI